MAALLEAALVHKSLRRQRVFRDRTKQLEVLCDGELLARYRMPRHALITILDMVRDDICHPTHRSRALSPETQFLLTMRFLCKGGFLMEVGDLHGVSEASVSRSFHRTVRALCARLPQIVFPAAEDRKTVMQGFHRVARMPQVIGAIDGTLIPIKRPHKDEEAYVCRKQYHALNIQAVCDSRLRCLHRSTGCLQFEPPKCALITKACFLLHNFCVEMNLPEPDLIDEEELIVQADCNQQPHATGQHTRQLLIDRLFS